MPQETESSQIEPLRILVADERTERLVKIADIVESLGHEVGARETSIDRAAATTEREQPYIAFVELGETTAHALD